ncbi:MAG TPA: hypothetical protein VID93_06440 [Acidimicrobiales bacterium]|jgi:hypothetical protein
MRNLIYLLVALGVIGLGTLILALRAREPKGFDSGIRAHQRHMEALSTEVRRESTGIDRVQPLRRVDPLTPEMDPTDADDPVDEDAEPPGAPGAEG